MELQRQLDFQQTFDEGSSSSNQTSVIPNPYQRAEKLDMRAKLSKEAEQVLLGSLLGDGNLRKRWQISGGGEYREAHSIKQKEYLEWKSKILNLPSELKSYNSNSIWYRTKSIIILNNYYNIFYPNGRKVVTREILDKLEPLGIAVWYCDDGSYNYWHDFIIISTHSFSYEEHLIIQEWFKNKLLLDCKIQKYHKQNKDYYFIRLNSFNTKKFIELIKYYVIECMSYKLGFDKERKKQKENKIKSSERYRKKISLKV